MASQISIQDFNKSLDEKYGELRPKLTRTPLAQEVDIVDLHKRVHQFISKILNQKRIPSAKNCQSDLSPSTSRGMPLPLERDE